MTCLVLLFSTGKVQNRLKINHPGFENWTLGKNCVYFQGAQELMLYQCSPVSKVVNPVPLNSATK